jgi:hypothetical protein
MCIMLVCGFVEKVNVIPIEYACFNLPVREQHQICSGITADNQKALRQFAFIFTVPGFEVKIVFQVDSKKTSIKLSVFNEAT